MTVLASRGPSTDDKPLVRVGRGKANRVKRPVTATLAFPIMLDITFLKKLDMTSFTKKGLMAISKLCGISIVKRADDRRTRKRGKGSGMAERGRRDCRRISLSKERTDDEGMWRGSRRVPKIKVTDQTRAENVKDGSVSRKAVCPLFRKRDGKPTVDDILFKSTESFVVEPCKTCGRSQQPERFHSHPRQKVQGKNSPGESPVRSSGRQRPNQPEKLEIPKVIQSGGRRHSTGHLGTDLPIRDIESSFHSDHETESAKMSRPRGGSRCRDLGRNAISFRELPERNPGLGCGGCKPEQNPRRVGSTTKTVGSRKECDTRAQAKGSSSPAATDQTSVEPCQRVSPRHRGQSPQAKGDQLKYVTGCYICGKQMSSELRMDHEEQCIATWRKNNSRLSPDKRKPEPLRPDYRFTAAGDVDLEGTFKSIWANHMDSLVPCGKCHRTFFPERIERHEACCNGQETTKSKHRAHKKK